MIDPPEILQRKAISKKREFEALGQKLRRMKPKASDLLFHELHQEAFDTIDCLECANCCRGLGPRIE